MGADADIRGAHVHVARPQTACLRLRRARPVDSTMGPGGYRGPWAIDR
ncbi:MAG: hypothetical protein P8Y48_13980 [Novosphingobium sp.]